MLGIGSQDEQCGSTDKITNQNCSFLHPLKVTTNLTIYYFISRILKSIFEFHAERVGDYKPFVDTIVKSN